MKKIYSEMELQVFLLRFKQEWIERCIDKLADGKPPYSFDDYLTVYYSNPDEVDEAILTQLFDEQMIGMIPFGHWCVECGAPIATLGSDYCDSCMVAIEEINGGEG